MLLIIVDFSLSLYLPHLQQMTGLNWAVLLIQYLVLKYCILKSKYVVENCLYKIRLQTPFRLNDVSGSC